MTDARAPRVLVTRPEGQEGELVDELRAESIETVHVPTVTILPEAHDALDDALEAPDGLDWLVVTSANGARAVAAALARNEAVLPASLKVAAVGPVTAEALRAAGIGVDAMPSEYRTLAIADALGPLDGRCVLLARPDSASDELRHALEERGAQVLEVVAYRTGEPPRSSAPRLRDALAAGIDAAIFTSPSTVRGFVALLHPSQAAAGRRLPAFCIGPVTAGEAERIGLNVAGVAEPYTAKALAALVVEKLRSEVVA